MGLARASTLIAAARAECANSLVLDNGDFLQGTPLGDYAVNFEVRRNRRNPVQVPAPGYALVYLWAIRHLDGCRFGSDSRIFVPEHAWTLK